MNYILFDGTVRNALLPFTFTRPVADIRIGILTIREKWEWYLGQDTSTRTEDYLSGKYPMKAAAENILISGSVLPNPALIQAIRGLHENEALYWKDELIAFRTNGADMEIDACRSKIPFNGTLMQVRNTWDIFSENGEALQSDFDLITKGRKSAPVSPTNQLIHPEKIFLEEGASVEYSLLNATEGPIYLGKDSEVWEGNARSPARTGSSGRFPPRPATPGDPGCRGRAC